MAKLNWSLRDWVKKKKILWCSNKGNSSSCKPVLFIINLHRGFFWSLNILNFPQYKTDLIFSKVERIFNCKSNTNFIEI